jgi:hypothetical protein
MPNATSNQVGQFPGMAGQFGQDLKKRFDLLKNSKTKKSNNK